MDSPVLRCVALRSSVLLFVLLFVAECGCVTGCGSMRLCVALCVIARGCVWLVSWCGRVGLSVD